MILIEFYCIRIVRERIERMMAEWTWQDSIDIYKLFEHKGWPVDEKNKSSLFNRFIHIYNKLTDEEKELFINLSYHYEMVPLDRYQTLLTSVLSNAVKNHIGQKQTVYVYPIKKRADHNHVKSADLVAYLCNGIQVHYIDELSKKKFVCLGSMDRVEEKSSNIIKNKLVILDDFIGSGDYATDVVNEITALGIPAEQIVIAALFITQNAVNRLRALNCGIEYGEMIELHISKLTNSEKEIMSRMEQKIGVDAEFSFGYGHGAALISLIRTPNNTLPIFWKTNGRAYAPPFPRSK